MRVTHEGDVDPVKLSTGGTGGTDPPVVDCCDLEPGDQPDLAENPDGLGDSSAHALEDVPGTPDDQNLAHGTVVDGGGSPTWNDISHPPAHANDGNVSTFARLNSGVFGVATAYLKTDLGAAYAIGEIVVIGSDNGGTLPAGLTVDWSTDGSSWTATGLSPVVTGGNPWTETYTPSSPITARYWRLVWAHGGGFQNGKDVNTWELNGPSVLGTAWSLPVPEVIDGDDATYVDIDGPEVVRIDLGSAMRTGSTRIRIGTATSGSRTYNIDAWNALDESDRVTLATFTFTATGSFTAQDVVASWFTDTDYQWFELDGDDEDRYVYEWALFAPTLATNHEHAVTLDDLTDVDTSGAADDDVLTYDAGTGTWVAGTPSGGSLTDHTHAATGSGSNGGGSTLQPVTLDLPAASSPAQTADGRVVWDSDDDVITVGDGASRKTFGKLGSTVGTALGTAAAGSSVEASRVDHVHTLVKLDDTAAPDDNTDRDVSTSAHGLVPKITGSDGYTLQKSGTAAVWAAGGGGGSLTVEGSTGSPTDSATTKLVFPSDALSITSHVATIRSVPTGFIGCSVSGSTTTTSSGAAVSLAFANADTYDTDGFHDPASNNTRLTVPAGLGGKYLLTPFCSFPASDTDRRLIYRINGGSDIILVRPYFNDAGAGWYLNGATVLDLAAGDYVEVRAWSSVGGGALAYRAELSRLSPGGSAGPGVGAKVYNATTQAVTTVFTYDSEEWDTDGFHSTGSNTSRITIPAGLGGKYRLTANAYVAGATSRDLWFLLNGTTALRGTYQGGGSTAGTIITADVALVAGDYVEVTTSTTGTYGHASDPKIQSAFSAMRLDSGSGVVPGTQLDYAEQTTPLNPIVPSAEASATAFLTGAGFTADGASSYMVEAFIPIAYVAAGHAVNLWLFDGGSSIGQIGQLYSSGSATVGSALHLMRRVTPGAGTKTYSIRATSDASTGSSLFCGAGGAGTILPAYIRVTKS